MTFNMMFIFRIKHTHKEFGCNDF